MCRDSFERWLASWRAPERVRSRSPPCCQPTAPLLSQASCAPGHSLCGRAQAGEAAAERVGDGGGDSGGAAGGGGSEHVLHAEGKPGRVRGRSGRLACAQLSVPSTALSIEAVLGSALCTSPTAAGQTASSVDSPC